MKSSIQRFFTDDKHVFAVIALNAFVLFLLSFPYSSQYIYWLEVIDVLFLSYFGLEAWFKVRMLGWKTYFSSGWNQFDFALVILSIPTVLVLIRGNWSDLALFFLLRTVRVARFFKFLRFVPNIQELIAGLKRAFRASLFVILAFMVYGFVIALVSCRLFQQIEPEMFGNPLSALYYVFQIFTIEGWNAVPEAILDTGKVEGIWVYFVKLYFAIIVATGGLFGWSIVNAIFVEEMVRDNNDGLIASVKRLNEKVDLLLAAQEKAKNVGDTPPID